MTRLGATIRHILAPDPTMGHARVATIEGPGEITLAGRDERVLVAGSSMPQVGERIPWVLVEPGLLVATHNLPQMAPAPVHAAFDLGAIGITAELLYGDGLGIGWHYYAACFPPAQGGQEMSPYSPSGPMWVRARSINPPTISKASLQVTYNIGEGSFVHVDEGDPDPGTFYSIGVTCFNADSPEQETTLSNTFWLSPLLGADYNYSLSIRLPSSGLARNGGVRVYISTIAGYGSQGPYLRSFEFSGESTPGYDIYDHLDVTIGGPGEGPEPPAVNTLNASQVGLVVSPNETEPPTVMDMGVDELWLYRTPIALPDYGGDDPPAVGYIGEVEVPVVAIQAKSFCFVDDGIPAGDPPVLPWPEGES